MKLTKFVVAVGLCAVTLQAHALGGWLGKQLDNMGGSNSSKDAVIAHERRYQGDRIVVAPGQNYRIPGTTMTIIRQNGPLVKIDPPTGERYVVIIDDDPTVARYQAYSVDCNTYRYRNEQNIHEYKQPGHGEYGGAVSYAACTLPVNQ